MNLFGFVDDISMSVRHSLIIYEISIYTTNKYRTQLVHTRHRHSFLLIGRISISGIFNDLTDPSTPGGIIFDS